MRPFAGDQIEVSILDGEDVRHHFATGAITMADVGLTYLQHETAGFGLAAKRYLNGQLQAPVTLRGHITTEAAGTHTVLERAYRNSAEITLMVQVLGGDGYSGQFVVERYNVTIESGSAMTFEAALKPRTGVAPQWAFRLLVTTTAANETISPTFNSTEALTVDWGDGQVETVAALTIPGINHTYDQAGTYTILVSGGHRSLTRLVTQNRSYDYTLSDVSGLKNLIQLAANSSQVQGTKGLGYLHQLSTINIANCGLSQTEVDAVIRDIHANRGQFTDPAPTLTLAGNNAAPSASVVSNEIAELQGTPYDWAITYTGGP